VFRETFFWSLS